MDLTDVKATYTQAGGKGGFAYFEGVDSNTIY